MMQNNSNDTFSSRNDNFKVDSNLTFKEKMLYLHGRSVFSLLFLFLARLGLYGFTIIKTLDSIKSKVDPIQVMNSVYQFRFVMVVPLLIITSLYLLLKKKYKILPFFLLLDFGYVYLIFKIANDYFIKYM